MSHLVQLVDANDNLLGYKERDELIDSDTWRIIFVDIHDLSDDYILIQKRSLQKKIHPGIWTIATAGTLEDGDTYESCAHREIKEEIGVDGCQLEDKGKRFYKSVLGYRQCMSYAAKITIDTPLVLQESEVSEARWISQDDLKAWVVSSPEDFTEYSIDIWKNSGVI